MTGAEPEPERFEKSEAIRWRIRLSDRDPRKTWVIWAAGVLAFSVGALVFKNPLLGIVGFAIIFGSTAEFWLGSAFSIDEKGASVRTGFSISAMEWRDVKRVIKDSGGIRLSPLEQPGTMDAFRGVYLRYGNENREHIEKAVLKFGQLSTNHVVDGSDGGGDRNSDSEGGG
jgi:hypothetical protein